jgi:hypothetical protein
VRFALRSSYFDYNTQFAVDYELMVGREGPFRHAAKVHADATHRISTERMATALRSAVETLIEKLEKERPDDD